MIHRLMRLRLFVHGGSPRSAVALHNLTLFRRDQGEDLVDFEVVDVLTNTHLAEENKILATPTLVRLMPLPVVRIVGDLSDRSTLASLISASRLIM